MLSADRIALKQEAQSWEEGVRAAGRLLYESGAVTYEYIEAMVENIKVNGSYVVIYSGIAAPHAEQEKGAVREAASLVSLKKPVVFGNSENDPVSYIIGLSILNANSINCAIYNLVRLFHRRRQKAELKLSSLRRSCLRQSGGWKMNTADKIRSRTFLWFCSFFASQQAYARFMYYD